MKTYLITTGTVFALITIAHIVRVALEPRHVLTDAFFMTLTILAAALSIWAWVLLRRLSRR